MGRKWRIGGNLFGWNFDPCEETLLIASYEEVKPYIPANQTWKLEFEQRYFHGGDGVAQSVIDNINVERRRKNLDLLEFRETDVGDYARDPDKPMKAKRRREMQAEVLEWPLDHRSRMMNHLRAEVAQLLPSHRTFDEHEAITARQRMDAPLSQLESANRRTALESVGKRRALDCEMAVRMLQLATDDDLRSDIITAMSGPDAMAAAAETEDADLRNLLVRHALSALTGR